MKMSSTQKESNFLALLISVFGIIPTLFSLFLGYNVEIKVHKKKDNEISE